MNANNSDCTRWWKESGEAASHTYHSVPLCYNYGVKKVVVVKVEADVILR
jgi:hypothetical protein